MDKLINSSIIEEPIKPILWSEEEAEVCDKKCEFIRLSDTDRTSMRHLSGAERIWTNNEVTGKEKEIYHLGTRICGTPGNIRRVLSGCGKSSEDVEKIISESISFSNYTTTSKSDYEKEVNRWITFKNDKKEDKKKNAISFNDLIRNTEHLPSAQFVIASDSTRMKKKGGKAKFFIEQFNKIRDKEGKCVDVTLMTQDGMFTRVQATPVSDRGQKVYIHPIPIVSKKEESYLWAMELLFQQGEMENEEEYRKIVNKVKARFSKNRRETH